MLLDARARDQALSSTPNTLGEVLVGDDAEADAFVYSLYADSCEGRVDTKLLKRVLERGKVYEDQIEICTRALDRIERGPFVRRILIHLDRQTSPSSFREYGGRVVPFYNYFQAALVLAEDGRLGPEAVLRVASELAEQHRFDADALARSYSELVRRGHAQGSLVPALQDALAALEGRLPTLTELRRMVDALGKTLEPAREALGEAELDYVVLADRHRGGKNRKRPRGVSAS
jgi:hypothetical protein